MYPLRYEPRIEELNDSKRQLEVEKINSELLVKLGDLDADLIFSTGQYCACPQHRAPFITSDTQGFILPSIQGMVQTWFCFCLLYLLTSLPPSSGLEFGPEKDCIFIGMATEDLDVAELVDTIAALGRDIEENGRVTLSPSTLFTYSLSLPPTWLVLPDYIDF